MRCCGQGREVVCGSQSQNIGGNGSVCSLLGDNAVMSIGMFNAYTGSYAVWVIHSMIMLGKIC